MDSERILVVFGLLLVGVSCRSAIFPGPFEDSYNQPNSLSPIGGLGGVGRINWVKVEQLTGRVVRVPQGQRVELVCKATGSPSPSIRWFKGSQQITPLQAFEESNDISGSRFGSVVSKYVIDCAQPMHQGTYTCTGYAGGESSATLPTALIVEANISNLRPTCEASETKPPKIFVSRPVALEANNNDVVLPCTASGKPKPNIFWLDEDNKLVETTRDARFKVLESGDLSISRIRWSDMGRYMCVAENKEGRDTATTFLYPLKKDD